MKTRIKRKVWLRIMELHCSGVPEKEWDRVCRREYNHAIADCARWLKEYRKEKYKDEKASV